MLADEELIGVLPRADEVVNKKWRNVGWYTDERGYKKFGVIPDKDQITQTNIRNEYDPSRDRSSRPRYN